MPTHEELERAHLHLADQHIAECERHVTEQELRIERLREDGHDIAAFATMLKAFKDTLATQRQHRELILKRINDAGTL